MRFWTCHWRNCYWRDDVNREFEPIDCSGSNLFSKRGVMPGDRAYIITLSEGQLFLGGSMLIEQIVPRATATRVTGQKGLYDSAGEWIIATKQKGTQLDLHRKLHPSLTRELRFVSHTGKAPRPPFFVDHCRLDVQATRGVRELTSESAAILDQIIEITDARLRSRECTTVTPKMLRRR